MSKYVPDIQTRRWVVISPQRLERPYQQRKSALCPFCPGNEKETPPEVLRFGEGQKDKPGWKVRVFPNKYAITDIHEVIVHSPDDDKDIEDLPLPQIELILKAYRHRYNAYKEKGQVIIFCNHGFHAGASLKHPHSQLVVIPKQINLDTLVREPIQNKISENKFFIIYVPDFSQWPYESWIVPKTEGKVFGEIEDEEIHHLVEVLQKMLKRLVHVYKKHNVSELPLSYNYYIYPKENWYLRIIPRFVNRAGFELGTGISVNIIDPDDAAEDLKK